jgi:DNA topoisomerase I
MELALANDFSLKITPAKLRAILSDNEKSAKAVHLKYVNDGMSGILRKRRGKNFVYEYEGKKVTDNDVLVRIRKLVIPPAWEKVWICPDENGHIQVTGIDKNNRKQYRYHPLWTALRNETKYYRIQSFGSALQNIRKQIKEDLALPGMQRRKVLAAMVSLMEQTGIRIGNNFYEKLYGSFGLSTLKDQHVHIKGKKLQFEFRGKKGVYHKIELCSPRLARIVQQCKDIPGKELFQFYDDEGNRHTVDSGDVNAYIKEIAGEGFTSKDFRTWSGTLHCLQALAETEGEAATKTQVKKNIVAALDKVAAALGNTRSVCKKHYVYPMLLSMYEENSLGKHLDVLKTCDAEKAGEVAEEVLLGLLTHN